MLYSWQMQLVPAKIQCRNGIIIKASAEEKQSQQKHGAELD